MEGYLTWQGRMTDVIAMGQVGPDMLGPVTISRLCLITLHKDLLEDLKLQLRGKWAVTQTWEETVRLLRDLLNITKPAVRNSLS